MTGAKLIADADELPGGKAKPVWPAFAEPELVERLTMNQPDFFELWRNLREKLTPREYNRDVFERGTGYPRARPLGSFVLTEGEGELLAGMDQVEQRQTIDRFSSSESGNSGRGPSGRTRNRRR